MTNNTIVGLLAGVAMAAVTGAQAAENPVPAVDVIVKRNGIAVTHAETDAQGNFKLGQLAPGAYTIRIGQASWTRAVERTGGAAGYANIEINYLLQRMERVPVATVRLPAARGDLTGRFTIPGGRSADRDAVYRGTLSADLAAPERGVTHDPDFEKAGTAHTPAQGRVSLDADNNESCAKRTNVKDSHDRSATGTKPAGAHCRDKYIGETEKNLRRMRPAKAGEPGTVPR